MRLRLWWLGASAVAVLIAADAIGQEREGVADVQMVVFLLASLALAVVACALCVLRPSSRVGALLLLFPLVALVDDLSVAYPLSSSVLTASIIASALPAPVFAHATLSYPTGRLGSAGLRLFVAIVYAVSLVRVVPVLLYFDFAGCTACSAYVNSLLYRGDPGFSFVTWNRVWGIVLLGVTVLYVVLLARKLRRAPRGAWRTLAPLMVAGTVGAAAFAARQLALVTGQYGWLSTLDTVETAVSVAIPIALAVGVLAIRHGRGPLGALVSSLERAGPGDVRDLLARAIGDPTLQLALWLPGRSEWVDVRGEAVSLPADPDGVTYVGEGAGRVAAILHDPALAEQRTLVEAAGSVARLALENERLQAELRAQLAELRASRARIVRTAADERRRLERDLHDGVQQRLLGVGLALQLLRPRIEPHGVAEEVLGEAEAELQAAVRELREFAHGIHPAILSDQGLLAAARALAVRSPMPVEVDGADDRLPPAVETAAYFLIAECLANVAKYARASHAWVRVERRNGRAVVEVGDDGVGGADPGRGSGLSGLADRIGALDGVLAFESPPGVGTRIVAEIPCA